MSAPQRIRLSRAKGWRMPPNTVNVARPTLYGNPFIHDDPAKAVEAFRRHCDGGTQTFAMGPGKLQFAKWLHRNSLHWAWPEWLRTEGLAALRGKNLACWCPIDQPCHADVLLELANQNTDAIGPAGGGSTSGAGDLGRGRAAPGGKPAAGAPSHFDPNPKGRKL